jgi:chemotaxis protein methyltransferase CheR
MKTSITPQEFEQITTIIHNYSGINIGAGKEYLIENRLGSLMKNKNYDSYFHLIGQLKRAPGPLHTEVIDALTTNETLWFRDNSFFAALTSSVIPMLLEKARSRSRINIWSMACSTGQEPYSVAMLIDSVANKTGATSQLGKFNILASDISTSALAIATKGNYSQLAITRGMRTEFLAKYFIKNDDTYDVSPKLKRMVRFRQFNLQNSYNTLGTFNLILCRNVLIYFDNDSIRKIYKNIHSVLDKDGLLAIGSTESSRSHTTQFDQVLMDGAAFSKPKA